MITTGTSYLERLIRVQSILSQTERGIKQPMIIVSPACVTYMWRDAISLVGLDQNRMVKFRTLQSLEKEMDSIVEPTIFVVDDMWPEHMVRLRDVAVKLSKAPVTHRLFMTKAQQPKPNPYPDLINQTLIIK
jgi:hypothetical protein